MTEKKETMSEEQAYSIALKDHPEYARALRRDELPDEIIGPSGEPMSPRMHLTVHSIVERQIANDEPSGVAEVACQLEQAGVDRHEIRHLVAIRLTDQLFRVMKYGKMFDEKRYLRELRKLARKYRHGSP